MKKNIIPLDERIVWYNKQGVVSVNVYNELWVWEWSDHQNCYIKSFEINNIFEGINYLEGVV